MDAPSLEGTSSEGAFSWSDDDVAQLVGELAQQRAALKRLLEENDDLSSSSMSMSKRQREAEEEQEEPGYLPWERPFFGSSLESEVVIEDELGRSGQATLYKGRFRQDQVAIKVFHKRHGMDEEEPEVTRAYFTEQQCFLRVGTHPNVLRLIACFEDPSPCLVTEYMLGGDLHDFIKRESRLEASQVQRLACLIARGLAHLHKHNVIHRDLKPKNILLRGSDPDTMEPVLADFGLAHISFNEDTLASGTPGTLYYIAPELFGGSGAPYTNKVDIYSFGITLWEMLSHMRINSQFPDTYVRMPQDVRPPVDDSWSKPLVRIMEQCWHTDPGKRPSAEEIVNLLSKVELDISHIDASLRDTINNCDVAEQLFGEGIAYAKGSDGFKFDLDKSATCFRRAAALGHAAACFHLALLYREREGFEKQTTHWCREAARRGDMFGQYEAARRFRDAIGTPQDRYESFRWMTQAAQQGLPNAQYELGMMYENGFGVGESILQAARWYHRAAIQQYSDAQCKLGELHLFGRGVTRNYGVALKWFRMAADQGHDEARHYIHRYLSERGTTIAPEQQELERKGLHQAPADETEALLLSTGMESAGLNKDRSASMFSLVERFKRQELTSMEHNEAINPHPEDRTMPFPRYPEVVIKRELGRTSGQAVVYKGKFRRTKVAIKVFSRRPEERDGEGGKNGKAYFTEQQCLLKTEHPNVLRLLACFERPSPCLVTEYMPGGDLHEFLKIEVKLNLVQTQRLACLIARGLAHLHKHNVIHRDLKPKNILLRGSDPDTMEPVLADFGLAHISFNEDTLASGTPGTLYYIAPELFDGVGARYTNKVDIYAFGLILWEMLSHKKLEEYLPNSFYELRDHVQNGRRPPLEGLQSEALRDVVERSWQTDPERRPSAISLVDQLSRSHEEAGRIDAERRVIAEREAKAQALFERARTLSDDPALKIECLKEAMSLGHAAAGTFLAVCYRSGEGVEKDEGMARSLFEEAARRGDPIAKSELSRHLSSEECPQDVRWMRIPAEQGHIHRLFEMGQKFERGEGIDQSFELAAQCYRDAAGRGHTEAQYRLAQLLELGLGAEESPEEAAHYYTQAAEGGHTDAQYLLGVMYHQGRGVERDLDQAERWYHHAAQRDHVMAQNNLGALFMMRGNDEQALRWFRRAAEQGSANAQFNVGLMYRDGRGVEPDAAAALDWLLRAASQDHVAAQSAVQDMLGDD